MRCGDLLEPIRLPFVIPRGAGSRVVDDDAPELMRCPIVIEGTPRIIENLFRKFWEHRI